jgi:hypothetical protein
MSRVFSMFAFCCWGDPGVDCLVLLRNTHWLVICIDVKLSCCFYVIDEQA